MVENLGLHHKIQEAEKRDVKEEALARSNPKNTSSDLHPATRLHLLHLLPLPLPVVDHPSRKGCHLYQISCAYRTGTFP